MNAKFNPMAEKQQQQKALAGKQAETDDLVITPEERREQILMHLSNALPGGLSKMEIKAVMCVHSAKTVDNDCYLLKKGGLIDQDEDGVYVLSSPAQQVIQPEEPPAAEDQPPADPEDTTFDASLNHALNDLEQQLQYRPACISDHGIKIATLDKLAQLLDPSIAEVLSAIADDLSIMEPCHD